MEYEESAIYSIKLCSLKEALNKTKLLELYPLNEISLNEDLSSDFIALSIEADLQKITQIKNIELSFYNIKHLALSIMGCHLYIVLDFDQITLSEGLLDSPSKIENTALKFSDLEEMCVTISTLFGKNIKPNTVKVSNVIPYNAF